MNRPRNQFVVIALAAIALGIHSTDVHAQFPPPPEWRLPHASLPSPHQDPVQATESQLYFAGFLGAVVGFGLGMAAGYGLEMTTSSSCTDYCGFGGGLIGMVLGESLGLALGTHLTNDRQGPLLETSTASLGIAVVGLLLATHIDAPSVRTPVLLAIPVTQLLTITGLEYRAQKRTPGP
jgi:hypothetical protein